MTEFALIAISLGLVLDQTAKHLKEQAPKYGYTRSRTRLIRCLNLMAAITFIIACVVVIASEISTVINL